MKRRAFFDRELLRRLRKGQRMTLRDLEAATGISNAYLSQLETGRMTNPTMDVVVAIADAFRLSLETFVVRATPR